MRRAWEEGEGGVGGGGGPLQSDFHLDLDLEWLTEDLKQKLQEKKREMWRWRRGYDCWGRKRKSMWLKSWRMSF